MSDGLCEVCKSGLRNTSHIMSKKHLHNLIRVMDEKIKKGAYNTNWRDYPFYFDMMGKKYSTKNKE
jgi:hypothetical protein